VAAAKKVKKIKAIPKAKLIQYRMSPIELRTIARDVLPELRQEDIAEMLMLAPRTMRRWLKGDAKIDGSSSALLRLLWAGRIQLRDIRAALARPGGAL
jgi:DNA-binding transcriptional regulator YiaG